MNGNEKEHWEHVYNTKSDQEKSWFQPVPSTSFDLIEHLNLSHDSAIIDIGAGDSRLVDVLLDRGYRNLWMLDISPTAIEHARTRLGEGAAGVHWIVSNVTGFHPPVTFDLWHDRAAFHFLTKQSDIDTYVLTASEAVKEGGALIIGTFAETGPEKCSGLEVRRYSAESLSGQFEADFEKLGCLEEDHQTPFGTHQQFLFCWFRRKQIIPT